MKSYIGRDALPFLCRRDKYGMPFKRNYIYRGRDVDEIPVEEASNIAQTEMAHG